jgi:hypothetical protein
MAIPKGHKEFARYIKLLGEKLADVFTFYDLAEVGYYRKGVKCVGTRDRRSAVAVLSDGSCFVGEARLSHKDSYNRKIGYRVAVGRALKSAYICSGYTKICDFKVDVKDLHNVKVIESKMMEL